MEATYIALQRGCVEVHFMSIYLGNWSVRDRGIRIHVMDRFSLSYLLGLRTEMYLRIPCGFCAREPLLSFNEVHWMHHTVTTVILHEGKSVVLFGKATDHPTSFSTQTSSLWVWWGHGNGSPCRIVFSGIIVLSRCARIKKMGQWRLTWRMNRILPQLSSMWWFFSTRGSFIWITEQHDSCGSLILCLYLRKMKILKVFYSFFGLKHINRSYLSFFCILSSLQKEGIAWNVKNKKRMHERNHPAGRT